MAIRNVTTRTRTIGYVDYRAGQTERLKLETGGVLLETYLQLSYTVTTGLTAPTGYVTAGIARLLRNVEIELAEQDEVLSLDGLSLIANAQLDNGIMPSGYVDVSAATSTATNYLLSIPITHWLAGSQNPLMTALDLRGIPSAILRVHWGDISDIFTTVNTAVLSNVKLEVIGVFLDSAPADMPQRLVRDFSTRSYQIPAQQDDWRFTIDKRSGKHLRSIRLLSMRNEFTYGAPYDDQVFTGDITVQTGGQVLHRVPANFFADRWRNHRQFAPMTGMHPIIFPSLGDPGQMIDMNTLDTDLEVKAPVSGPVGVGEICSVRPILEQVRSLRVS